MVDAKLGWLETEAGRRGLERVGLTPCRAGHLTVDAKVEGRDARLILDTGASRTFLDRASAAELGVGVGADDVANAGACGTGAGGAVSVSFTPVSSLQIQALALGPLEMGLLDLSGVNEKLRLAGDAPVHGILGGDMLRRHSAIIDLAGRALYLRVEG
jgi:aspartyl protease family protein